jgi:hypothetical protein
MLTLSITSLAAPKLIYSINTSADPTAVPQKLHNPCSVQFSSVARPAKAIIMCHQLEQPMTCLTAAIPATLHSTDHDSADVWDISSQCI